MCISLEKAGVIPYSGAQAPADLLKLLKQYAKNTIGVKNGELATIIKIQTEKPRQILKSDGIGN